MADAQSYLNNAGMAMGAGAFGSGLGSIFGSSGDNPYNAANKYLQQIPGAIGPYYNPYINAGREALPGLMQQYGNLINDPSSVMNKIGAGYHESPGYQFQFQQGMNAANNAAAAGGMSGTPAAQYNAANMATGLANQDYYNYLHNALGQYGLGLSGEADINQMGYNAADQYAGALGAGLMNQGNLAFSGAAAQNQAQGSGWGNILGGIGALGAFGGLF